LMDICHFTVPNCSSKRVILETPSEPDYLFLLTT